jgi:Tfp pilus assembly protein FimV
MNMHNNLKLKRAVAVALGMFALSFQQQALALGLGDINVQSHLGQAFRAKVKILSASDLKLNDANGTPCFKLDTSDDANALSNLNFKLSEINNDEATLTLSTTHIINEPILNLAILAECGNSVRRDYVVLLDPVLTAEEESPNEDVAAPLPETAVTKVQKTTKKHRQFDEPSADSKHVARHSVKKAIKNNTLNNIENSNIVLHVPGGNQGNDKKLTENNIQKSSQPRLSISGGDASNAPLISSNLRLDRKLTFTPDANAQPIVDTDLEDEMTAMNNRLAHLSSQVAILQNRNLSLESENKIKAQQIADAKTSENKFRWIGYALGAALVLVSWQLARKLWWRREYEKQIAEIEAAQPTIHVSEDDQSLENQEDSFDEVVSQNSNGTVNKSSKSRADKEPIVIDENAYDLSILDHADVFLSHGRTSLAIQLLQNHLIDHPKQSITIWLFLLDLLAKENLQAVYEQTALECKEHFNIKISEFAKGDKSSNQNLEAFPHLAEGLEQVWGTPASLVYLDDLIYNNRLEPRAGLDKGLIEELLLLKSIAQENVNSAEVIQLDEKKVALQEQKDALMAAKKAEKLQKLDEAFEQEQAKAKAGEKLYEFNLVEWK